jgi:SNF2 family DNA or RNA helicase
MQQNSYKYFEKIDLYTEHQIKEKDARRQEDTAKEILSRLREKQPGLILADEVGMGKTFVARRV